MSQTLYVEPKSVLDALCRVKKCFRHFIWRLRHPPAFKKAGYGARRDLAVEREAGARLKQAEELRGQVTDLAKGCWDRSHPRYSASQVTAQDVVAF